MDAAMDMDVDRDMDMENHEIRALVGGIQKFSTEDGPGIRTTVFLKGCPLNCLWCHNPELIDPLQQIIRLPNKCIGCGACAAECPNSAVTDDGGRLAMDWAKCARCLKCTEVCYARAVDPVAESMTVSQVLRIALQDRDFYRHTGGGVTISGGELLTQPDFVEALICACAEEGIDVCLDTSGYGSYEILEKLALHGNVSNVLFDMKLIDSDKHIKYTGVDNGIILDNLRRMAASTGLSAKIRMRMPLVAGVNDSSEIIRNTAGFLAASGLKHVTLLPYHRLGVSKMANIGGAQEAFQPPSDERLREIVAEMGSFGIEAEIMGRQL